MRVSHISQRTSGYCLYLRLWEIITFKQFSWIACEEHLQGWIGFGTEPKHNLHLRKPVGAGKSSERSCSVSIHNIYNIIKFKNINLFISKYIISILWNSCLKQINGIKFPVFLVSMWIFSFSTLTILKNKFKMKDNYLNKIIPSRRIHKTLQHFFFHSSVISMEMSWIL